MIVQIEEVLRRSEQGITLPFICRGEDGKTYFVKGKSTGRRSLIAEYICGRLAVAFGLPVAKFTIVDIPEKIVELLLLPVIKDLGAGLAFGSHAVPYVQELGYHQLKSIPAQTCKDILVFDWWIRNPDRTLTPDKGNPNLLWDLADKRIVVIDHNLAFAPDFDKASFAESHVFSSFIPAVFHDLAERANYQERLQQAFEEYELACDNLPDEWWWVDDGVPAHFDRNEAKALLAGFDRDDFWNLAK